MSLFDWLGLLAFGIALLVLVEWRARKYQRAAITLAESVSVRVSEKVVRQILLQRDLQPKRHPPGYRDPLHSADPPARSRA